MANEHPKFEDDVPQFSGKIIDVIACEADETKPPSPWATPPQERIHWTAEAEHQDCTRSGRPRNFNVDHAVKTLRSNGRDGERKFAMTAVIRKTEPVTKTGSAGDNFHTLCDGEQSESEESETDLENLGEQDLWYATEYKAEDEAMIGLREAM